MYRVREGARARVYVGPAHGPRARWAGRRDPGRTVPSGRAGPVRRETRAGTPGAGARVRVRPLHAVPAPASPGEAGTEVSGAGATGPVQEGRAGPCTTGPARNAGRGRRDHSAGSGYGRLGATVTSHGPRVPSHSPGPPDREPGRSGGRQGCRGHRTPGHARAGRAVVAAPPGGCGVTGPPAPRGAPRSSSPCPSPGRAVGRRSPRGSSAARRSTLGCRPAPGGCRSSPDC